MSGIDSETKVETRIAFAQQLNRGCIPFTAAIVISLICNILALLHPFLEFSVAFKGKQFYSIPLTIQLMWEIKLYAAAVLVMGFSLIFPFVKLAMLLMIIWKPMTASTRHSYLTFLRNMGRWSLLDIFVILTILVLANNQIFMGAAPRVGATLFLIAICMSMLISELLDYLNGGMDRASREFSLPGRHPPYAQSGWTFWLMFGLLILAFLSLLTALGLPYFRVSQFLLRHNSYSVVESIMALRDSGAIAFSGAMFLFLVLLPFVKLCLTSVSGFVPMASRSRGRMAWWSSSLGAWSMLDVFALALLLFMAEGGRMVKFEVRSGFYMIILSVAIFYLVWGVNEHLIRRQKRRATDLA